jgi:hypothetical protein
MPVRHARVYEKYSVRVVQHARVYEKYFKCNGIGFSIYQFIYIIDISLNIEMEYLYRWFQTQWQGQHILLLTNYRVQTSYAVIFFDIECIDPLKHHNEFIGWMGDSVGNELKEHCSEWCILVCYYNPDHGYARKLIPYNDVPFKRNNHWNNLHEVRVFMSSLLYIAAIN